MCLYEKEREERKERRRKRRRRRERERERLRRGKQKTARWANNPLVPLSPTPRVGSNVPPPFPKPQHFTYIRSPSSLLFPAVTPQRQQPSIPPIPSHASLLPMPRHDPDCQPRVGPDTDPAAVGEIGERGGRCSRVQSTGIGTTSFTHNRPFLLLVRVGTLGLSCDG